MRRGEQGPCCVSQQICIMLRSVGEKKKQESHHAPLVSCDAGRPSSHQKVPPSGHPQNSRNQNGFAFVHIECPNPTNLRQDGRRAGCLSLKPRNASLVAIARQLYACAPGQSPSKTHGLPSTVLAGRRRSGVHAVQGVPCK